MADKNVRLRITGDPSGAVDANKKVTESLKGLSQAEQNHNRRSEQLAKQQVKILKGIASISQTTSNAQQKDLKAIAAEFSAVTKAIQSQSKLQEKQLKALEKGFSDLVRSAKSAGDDAEKGTKRMSTSLDSLRNKSVVAFAGISAAIGMVTKTFGDFEAQLNTFQGISGATTQEMEKMNDLALRIASSTKFSASQVAEGATEMARMGFTVNEINESMDGFVTGAIAAGVGIEEFSALGGTALRGFKKDAKEAGSVTDVLVAAMNRSAISFSDLNLSMKYIGPAAASTNQSLETMTGILGLMADQGIKGEQAGTSMRAMLLRLVNPTKDVTGLLNKLGIQIKDSNGNMRGMDDIMNQVRESSAKYEPTVRAQIAATIFGTEAYSAAAAVLGTTKEKTDDYIKSVSNVNGISEDQAKIMQQGVKDALTKLKSQVEATAIAWGEEFAPAVETGIGLLKDVAKFAAEIPDPVKDAGVQVSLFVGGFAGLTAVVTTLTLVKKGIDAVALSAAAGAPNVAAFWTAATGPVGWAATGIGLGANLLINQGAEVINQNTANQNVENQRVGQMNDVLGNAQQALTAVQNGAAISVEQLENANSQLTAQIKQWQQRQDEINALPSQLAEWQRELNKEREKGGRTLRAAELEGYLAEYEKNKVAISKEIDVLVSQIRRFTGIQQGLEAAIKQRSATTPGGTPKPKGTEGAGNLFETGGGTTGASQAVKDMISGSKSERDRMAADLFNQALSTASQAVETVSVQSMMPAGIRRTDKYGDRIHPVYRTKKMHTGEDYGTPVGTPVLSPAAGTIAFSGELGGYGNAVIVDVGNGNYVLAAHNSKLYKNVGDTVKKGEQIAASGGAKGAPGSGTSTGPHLHLEIRKGIAGLLGRQAFSGTRPVDPSGGVEAQSFDKEQARIDADKKANNAQILKLKQAIGKLDKKSLTYSQDKKALEDAIYEIETANTKNQSATLDAQLKQQEEQKKLAEQIEKQRKKAIDEYGEEVAKVFNDLSEENKKFEQEMLEQYMTPYEKRKAAFQREIDTKQQLLDSLKEDYNALAATDAERVPLLQQIEAIEGEISTRKRQQKEELEKMRTDEERATTETRIRVQWEKEKTDELQRQDHLTGALVANEADITAEKQRQQLAVQGMLSAFRDTAYAMGLIKDMMAATSVEATNIASNLASFAGGAASAIGQLPQDMPKKPEDMNAEQLAGLFSSGVAGARNWQNMVNAVVESIPGFKEADAMAQAYIDSGDFSISFDEFKKRKEGLQELVDSLPAFAKELEGIVAGLEVAKPDSEAYKSYRAGLANRSERDRLVDSFTNAYAGGNEAFAEQIRPIIEAASGEWMSIIDEVDKAFADRPVEEKNAEMFRRLAEKRKELDKQVSDARIAYTLAEEEKLNQQREKNLNEVGKVREKIFKEAVAVHEKEIDNFQREIDVLEQRKESLRDDIDALNQEEKAALSKFDVQDKAQFNRMVAGANVSARVQQALDEYINMQQMPMDRTSLRTQREALDQLLALDEQRNETAFLLEDKSAEAYVSTQKDLIAQRAQFIKLQMTDESLSVKERVGLNKEYADLYVQYKEIEQQAIRDKYDVERQKVNDSIELLDREQESIRDRISGEQQAIQDLTRTYEAEMEIIKNAVNAVRDALSAWSPAIEQVKTDLAGAMADANTAAEQFVNKLNSAELKMMRERANNDYGRASAGNVPVSPVRTNEYRVQGNNGWYISSSDMATAEGNFFNGGIVPDGHPRDTFRANLRSKEMVLPPNIASHITRSMNASVRKEDNLNLTVYARTKNDADIISQVVESKLKQYDKGNVHTNGNYYGPLY